MRLISAFISLALAGALCAATAPSPVAPLPWFIEHYRLGTVNTPQGVTVERIAAERVIISADAIVLRNTTSTPLYVIGIHDVRDPQYEAIPVVLPPGTGPINKIVSGQAFAWLVETSFTWVPDTWDHPDSIWLVSSFNNRIGSDSGSALVLKPLNDYGGNRPYDVKIPDPQSGLLRLVYGIEQLGIPVSVSYTLNENYKPENPYVASEYADWPVLGICLVFIVLAMGAILWITTSIRRGRGSE